MWVAHVWAAEVIDCLLVDGRTYEQVRFGAVNQGKIIMFHNRGVVTLPVESLPEHIRAQVAPSYAAPAVSAISAAPAAKQPSSPVPLASNQIARRTQPAPTRTPSASDSELQAFRYANATHVVLNGVLVERTKLTELTGFLSQTKSETGATEWIIELGQLSRDVPKHLELRPGLWKRTGEHVFLKGFKPDDTALLTGLVRVYGRELGKKDNFRIFEVGTPLTFEQWRKLQNK